jgi:tetratricopeptide (TPR) repeat protein
MEAAAALAKVASSPLQLGVLAIIYCDVGQLELALDYAKRAVALAPIDTWVLETEATILNELGRVEEALSVQRAAVAFLPEDDDGKAVLRRLSAYEERARAALR